MKKILNVGVAGCGMIADIYLKNMQHVFYDVLHVQGIFDLNPDAVRRRAEQYSLIPYKSYSDMLGDPEIDIILNLTAPQAHYTITRQAIEAGKHVYSEKPLAMSYQEGVQLLTLAERNNVTIGCSPDVPLGALIQTARKLVEEGAIGQVVGATANLVKQGVESWHPNPNFLYQPGGGPLLDMGPYYLTALLHIAGPFSAVSAMDTISFPVRTITSQPHYGETIDVNVPTYVNALLLMESGALATFTATFDVWKAKLPFIEIYGSEGTLCLSDPNLFGGTLQLARPCGEYEDVPLCFPYCDNNRGLGISDMARAILNGTESRTDGKYAVHVLETMDAIARSARSGQRILLETTCPKPAAMDS